MARTRFYFITDVHGSNRCFKKFLNAANFYQAKVIILGGDITGKARVPLVEGGDGSYHCTFQGENLVLKTKEEVDTLVARAGDSGTYTPTMTKTEFDEIEGNQTKLTAYFGQQMVERVRAWIALAEERLGKTDVKCYISPGNDDFFELDKTLDSSGFVINPEGEVVEIGAGHEMVTLGYANHTPWNSPREVDEDVLGQKIEAMMAGVKDMKKAVFNLHVPPINTPIDQAPMLDKDFKPVFKGGNLVMISAGSTAVRQAIEGHQPLIGLHGHIHESRGLIKIGKTLCLNPGSEYNSGILRGVVCELEGDKIKSHVLTSG